MNPRIALDMYEDRPAMCLRVLGRETRFRRLQNLPSQLAGTPKPAFVMPSKQLKLCPLVSAT
jgi:hypothetical protein